MENEASLMRELPAPIIGKMLGITTQELSHIRTRGGFNVGVKRMGVKSLYYSESDACVMLLAARLHRFSLDLVKSVEVAQFLVGASAVDAECGERFGYIDAADPESSSRIVFGADVLTEKLSKDGSFGLVVDIISYRQSTLKKLRDGIQEYLGSDDVIDVE